MNERLQAWSLSAPGFARRKARHLAQARYGWHHPRQVSFVFGCQRSGTKMLMWVFEKVPSARIFHENHLSAFRDFQLRGPRTIGALIRLCPAPQVIFKPICDSHRAREILDRFPEARGLWIFRDADDVANSSVKKWGSHQAEVIDTLVRGDTRTWGWRTAAVPGQVREAIRGVFRPDLSPHEGALLWWYLRNSFFFTQDLASHPRMLLVRYEDLVLDPGRAFPPVFAHLGLPFDPAFVAEVRASSVGRRDPPPASEPIRALCRELADRLQAASRT